MDGVIVGYQHYKHQLMEEKEVKRNATEAIATVFSALEVEEQGYLQ
ncbi:hypothetical protein [Paenibacillus mendelii]|uniref:Uncharacterized protein n=1 Tax=Paenibacillus mendelii TaxID=206163 RepID=A0ABV6JC99_9BACL|nr:hypothetical protein [Paenibacillus mendelii]MCQ6561525.1 hypothetical protein [Paenibacillus mendelii]